MSENQLLQAFAELGDRQPQVPGHTVAELASSSGHSQDWVRTRLQELQAEGKLTTSQRKDRSISGMTCYKPVYALAPKPKAKPKK